MACILRSFARMSFAFGRKQPVGSEVRRIALEQLDKALLEIRDEDVDLDETIHQLRKRLKKTRAVLRLARPAMEDVYKNLNGELRDAGRLLATVRDAQALVETVEVLRSDGAASLETGTLDSLERWLVERRERIKGEEQVGIRLAEVESRISAIRALFAKLDIPEMSFGEDLRPGLTKTYRRSRRAMRATDEEPSLETFHEWRKRAKYARYHVRLLRGVWTKPMRTLRRESNRLTDLLGEMHDLGRLRRVVIESEELRDRVPVSPLVALVDQLYAKRLLDAKDLGARIYAEKPKAYARRMNAYWSRWVRPHSGLGLSPGFAEANAA